MIKFGVLILALLSNSVSMAFSPNLLQQGCTITSLCMAEDHEGPVGRRGAFGAVLKGATIAVLPFLTLDNENANALDMDAFMNSELDKDVKNCDPKRDPKCIPKLTADEGMCKYGQSGTVRSEACKRLKEQGKEVPKPGSQGKSLGGAYAM